MNCNELQVMSVEDDCFLGRTISAKGSFQLLYSLRQMIVPRFRVEIGLTSFIRMYSGWKQFQNVLNENLLFLNSGSEALTFYLNNISENKEMTVGVPLYCCKSVYQSVISSGNSLRLLDIGINPAGYEIEYNDLENLDVLVLVHYFGFQCDRLAEIKKRFPHLIIIEDCSHISLKKFRQCAASNVAVFSFNFHKPISAGIGGALFLNNEPKKEKIIQNYNALPKRSFLKNVIPMFFVFCKNFAFNPIIYSLLEKFVNKRRHRPRINIADIIQPRKLGFVGKCLIGNQLDTSKDFDGKYRNLPREIIIESGRDSLSYFPIFCKAGSERNWLLRKFRENQIDGFVLWENTFYNAAFYGLKNEFQFENTKAILNSILFIPESMFSNDKRFRKLGKILEDYQERVNSKSV